jgi:hypothetical protein
MNHFQHQLFDDCDSDTDDDKDDMVLDTQWIHDYETQMMHDEYQLFLKTDITCITFDFYYLDRDKRCVENIVPMKYQLRRTNQINQHEIFSIVRSHQFVDKKYFNFHSLLLYSFEFQDCNDIAHSLSQYIQQDMVTSKESVTSSSTKGIIEYTNLLSIDVIYFSPLVTMFHECIGFSVLLYED